MRKAIAFGAMRASCSAVPHASPAMTPSMWARKLLREKRNTGFYAPLPYPRAPIGCVASGG